MRALSIGRLLSLASLGSVLLLTAAPTAAQQNIQIKALQADPKLNAMLPEKIRKAGVMNLATDANYPPCESMAEDNKTMIGWEPDFWNALGQVLGVRVEAVSIKFAGLIPGVASGRYDIAMECIADNAERQKQVMFVDVMYARSAAYTLESNKTITDDPLSFCGLKSATQQGTNFTPAIEELMSPHCTKNGKAAIENSIFPSVDATLLALYSGRVDFVLNNAMSVGALKQKAPKPIRAVQVPIIPTRFIGIVVHKENTQLAGALLEATKALHKSGVYDQIVEKWDLHLLKLPEPGINLATKSAPKG
jgi:polar amino acid transport system substrate-binding protein